MVGFITGGTVEHCKTIVRALRACFIPGSTTEMLSQHNGTSSFFNVYCTCIYVCVFVCVCVYIMCIYKMYVCVCVMYIIHVYTCIYMYMYIF